VAVKENLKLFLREAPTLFHRLFSEETIQGPWRLGCASQRGQRGASGHTLKFQAIVNRLMLDLHIPLVNLEPSNAVDYIGVTLSCFPGVLERMRFEDRQAA